MFNKKKWAREDYRKNPEKYLKYAERYRKKNQKELLEKSKQYYQDNHKKILENGKKCREDKKQYLDKYKLSKGCERCGYSECPEALHFHHIGDKEFCISKAIYDGTSLEKIKEEIKKCVILCANCHAEITFKKQLTIC